MLIELLEFEDGAERANGVTVIIDVFRAFSVACYAYYSGAARVIATGSPDEAFRLRKSYRKSLLAGERNERKISGFDFGNSPTEMLESQLEGYTVILTTTAGTNGLLKASNASRLLTGSLVNASAVAEYILTLNPEKVSLVAMGYRGKVHAEEDLLCSRIIESRLRGTPADLSDEVVALKESSGRRFFMPDNLDFSPPTDFFLCTMTDRFRFVLRGERRPDGNVDLIKIDL